MAALVKDVCNLQNAKSIVCAIVENLPEIVSNLQLIADKIVNVITTAVENIIMLKVTQLHLKYQAEQVCDDLWGVILLASYYCESVVGFLRRGQKESVEKRVMEGIEKKIYDLLQTFLHQLSRNLLRASEDYKKFAEACTTARDRFTTTIKECEEKRREAISKRTATRRFGGAAAAGTIVAGLGTGVVLSVAAGVATLGVGAVVGLGVTAGVAAVGGVVVGSTTAATTCVLASDFTKTADVLTKFCSSVESIDSVAAGMSIQLKKLTLDLDSLSTDVKEIEDDVSMKDCGFVDTAVEDLFEAMRKSYQLSLSCQEKIKEGQKRFETEITF